MSFFSSLQKVFGIRKKEPLFVYIKIPAPIQPLERGSRFEDPLDAALKRARVGEVTGGGSQLSDADADGRRTIEFCGIDVDLTDPDAGLDVLQRELAKLHVPEGTVLQYRYNGEKHEVQVRAQ